MKNKFSIGEEVIFLTSMGRCFSIALHPQLGEAECTGIKAKVVEVNIAMYDKGCFNPECMSGDCQISYSIEIEGIPNKREFVFSSLSWKRFLIKNRKIITMKSVRLSL